MNMNTTTDNVDLIGKYAPQTGAAFEKTRNGIIDKMHEGIGADIGDAFSHAHVGVARLVEQLMPEIHGHERVDRAQTAYTLVLINSIIMMTQDTINVHHEHLAKLMGGEHKDLLVKGAIAMGNGDIMRRRDDALKLLHAIVGTFMTNTIDVELGRR